jgi:hypothetical protein
METIRFYTALIYLRTHEVDGAKREIKSKSERKGKGETPYHTGRRGGARARGGGNDGDGGDDGAHEKNATTESGRKEGRLQAGIPVGYKWLGRHGCP